MKSKEYLFGISMLLVGGVLITESRHFSSLPGMPVGPSLFPTLIGIGSILVGATAVFRTYRMKVPDMDAAPPRTDFGSPVQALKFLGVLACIVAFALLGIDLGFILAASLVVTAFLKIVGRPLKTALPIAVISSICCYLFFDQGLGAMLPAGPFELLIQGVLHG